MVLLSLHFEGYTVTLCALDDSGLQGKMAVAFAVIHTWTCDFFSREEADLMRLSRREP